MTRPRRCAGEESWTSAFALEVKSENDIPSRSRRTSATSIELTNASASIDRLNPTAPPTNTRGLASRRLAVASAPTSAPSPNAAERTPNMPAPTFSVCEASSGTSTWKLNPTRLTTVTTTSTILASGVCTAQTRPSRMPATTFVPGRFSTG